MAVYFVFKKNLCLYVVILREMTKFITKNNFNVNYNWHNVNGLILIDIVVYVTIIMVYTISKIKHMILN